MNNKVLRVIAKRPLKRYQMVTSDDVISNPTRLQWIWCDVKAHARNLWDLVRELPATVLAVAQRMPVIGWLLWLCLTLYAWAILALVAIWLFKRFQP